MSSAYHPQTDGQTEALNHCLETYLRCFVSTKQIQWSKWLHWAEYWYNTSYQTSTRLTPFEVVYGRPPLVLHRYELGTTIAAQVESTLRDPDVILGTLKDNLVVAQDRMKTNSDKHRREQTFDVDDLVYLKLQLFCQSTMRNHEKMKYLHVTTGRIVFLNGLGMWLKDWNYQPMLAFTPSFMCHNLRGP